MIKKILIASRGEIALRVLRACKEIGIQTVAVHSTADSDAMHVKLADESVCIGPPPAVKSYLNIPAILTACEITGADAIHPGYGFLSENANFAEICESHSVLFIGPKAEHIRCMGNKIEAKRMAKKLKIPTVPGSETPIETEKDASRIAAKIGYPVLIKAAAGGGGRGMRVVYRESELAQALTTTKMEATNAFGDGTVYIEKYLENPRHIEIQILGNGKNNVVHLMERDCSIQRRNQKLWEEAPSPALQEKTRKHITDIVCHALAELNYSGAGTVEFLYENDKFYFIEMNTRIQVEHPVTEMITGIDLVAEQIRFAAGYDFTFKQSDIKIQGHAIECRINVENPVSFLPSPGKITHYHPPGGLGVRVDSAVYQGYNVPYHYDSLIAKLIVHARSREECLARLSRSLDEFVIGGVDTLLPLFQKMVHHKAICSGEYDIHWLEKNLVQLSSE